MVEARTRRGPGRPRQEHVTASVRDAAVELVAESGTGALYSLGATLYEAVEGEPPFPRSTPVAALLDSPPAAGS